MIYFHDLMLILRFFQASNIMKNLECAKTRRQRSLLNYKTKVFDFGEVEISKSFLDGIFSRFSVDFSAFTAYA